MPQRRRARGRRGKTSRGRGGMRPSTIQGQLSLPSDARIVTVPVAEYLSVSLSTSPQYIAINPGPSTALSARLATLATVFAYARCVSFRMTFVANNDVVVAYVPGYPSTFVANFIENTQLPVSSVFLVGNSTVPALLRVPRGVLARGTSKWYPTNVVTASPEAYQGFVFWTGVAGTPLMRVLFESVYQFSSPVPTGFEMKRPFALDSSGQSGIQQVPIDPSTVVSGASIQDVVIVTPPATAQQRKVSKAEREFVSAASDAKLASNKKVP